MVESFNILIKGKKIFNTLVSYKSSDSFAAGFMKAIKLSTALCLGYQ